jgi:hypothetical protein
MLTAQIAFGEEMDKFGAQFLPLVTEALTFLVEEALPAFSGLLDTVGPILSDLVTKYVGPLEKGATVTDILTQSNEKDLEVANALADSTSGKMATAQIAFNEEMERFGYQFLPIVTEALTFLTTEALPAFTAILDAVGPVISDLVDNFVRPLVDSFAELFSMFEGSEGAISIFEVALFPLKVALTAIKTVIDAIIFGLKLLGLVSDVDIAAGEAATNAFRAGERDSISAAGARGGSSEGITVQNTITFGNDATSFVNTSLGSTTSLTSPSRTRIR